MVLRNIALMLAADAQAGFAYLENVAGLAIGSLRDGEAVHERSVRRPKVFDDKEAAFGLDTRMGARNRPRGNLQVGFRVAADRGYSVDCHIIGIASVSCYESKYPVIG